MSANQGYLLKGIGNKTPEDSAGLTIAMGLISKGQLISKCPFGVFKSPKKTKKIFVRISALASKKRSSQKNKFT